MGFKPTAYVPGKHDAPQEGVEYITVKQLKYLRALLSERAKAKELVDARLAELGITLDRMPKGDATKTIDWLKRIPRDPKPTSQAVEGIHYREGIVYKVQKSKKGHLYAKQLVVNEPDCSGCAEGGKRQPCEPRCTGDTEWLYVGRTPLPHLSESTLMTKDDAAEFGALYGVCANCGRTLTNEVSIAEGMGPICAGRFL